jgi:asparaginyl-tRNA synthetase
MLRRSVARPSRTRICASVKRHTVHGYSSSAVALPTISSLLYPQNRQPLSGESSGNPVTVQGFVRSVRKQKNVAFVALGDGTTLKPLQVVLSPDQTDG